MRILNSGKKSIHIGKGKRIPPGEFFDCTEETGKKIMGFCDFCEIIPQNTIRRVDGEPEENENPKSQ